MSVTARIDSSKSPCTSISMSSSSSCSSGSLSKNPQDPPISPYARLTATPAQLLWDYAIDKASTVAASLLPIADKAYSIVDKAISSAANFQDKVKEAEIKHQELHNLSLQPQPPQKMTPKRLLLLQIFNWFKQKKNLFSCVNALQRYLLTKMPLAWRPFLDVSSSLVINRLESAYPESKGGREKTKTKKLPLAISDKDIKELQDKPTIRDDAINSLDDLGIFSHLLPENCKEATFKLNTDHTYFSLLNRLNHQKAALNKKISNLTQVNKNKETEVEAKAEAGAGAEKKPPQNFALQILFDAKRNLELGFAKGQLYLVNLKIKRTHQAQKNHYLKVILSVLINNKEQKLKSPEGIKLQSELNGKYHYLKSNISTATKENKEAKEKNPILNLPDNHPLLKQTEKFLKELNKYEKQKNNIDQTSKIKYGSSTTIINTATTTSAAATTSSQSTDSTSTSTSTSNFQDSKNRLTNTGSDAFSKMPPTLQSLLRAASSGISGISSLIFTSRKSKIKEQNLSADVAFVRDILQAHINQFKEVDDEGVEKSVASNQNFGLDLPHPPPIISGEVSSMIDPQHTEIEIL